MVVAVVVVGSSGKQGDSAVAVRGKVGSHAGPFICAGRRFEGGKISSRRPTAEGPRRGRLGKNPGVDLGRQASVRCGAVGFDSSCR
jgi:hypothetical protein